MAFWLFKSEPDAYSIDDLERDKREPWTGIRNYQVRNMVRDDMKIGDELIFYHSSCKVPGAVGIARIASKAYPDPLQFESTSQYFDEKSNIDDPRWLLVDVEFVRKFTRTIPLTELKQHPELSDFLLNKRGNRLSIFPVNGKHWDTILSLE
ncbi:MAG: EVE domain-containing protein [Gammaproteobacteria bacterium]|nr:EVE domain-containing protein [Gammaproteobacteria bacterium]MDH4315598.1 EVE domain-containing protein [Gammaproteobacteria bacterium]MDH5500656.1 EVE domain-containing protein [Gammaproteobacteria bacterium]